eukprot:366209-Chlamydomonas_euryale.AAC.26
MACHPFRAKPVQSPQLWLLQCPCHLAARRPAAPTAAWRAPASPAVSWAAAVPAPPAKRAQRTAQPCSI